MSDTDHINEDEVLRRMLNTPHEKHKPLKVMGGSKEDKTVSPMTPPRSPGVRPPAPRPPPPPKPK